MCKRLSVLISFVLVLGLVGSASAQLPEGWQSQDINTTDGGSAEVIDGAWTVSGGGADVWGSSDQFHYVYTEMTGDADIIAQVVSNGTGSNSWAKGGVMIRETTDLDSKHMIMALTGGEGGGITFQGRPITGDRSNSFHGDVTAAPPHWVRLTRESNTITAYHSADGVDWALFTDASPDGAQTNPIDVEMADPVLVGLFVTSHAAGEVRTFTFDNVSVESEVKVVSKASNPVPADGAVDVDAGTLEWATGGSAVSHIVYLSEDETIDDVDKIAETEMNIVIVDLAPGTTSYWRVDEVYADASILEGDVWSFSTTPLEAHFPSPADGASSQSLNSQLSWTPGKVAIMHNVHFGTDPAALLPVSMMQMDTSYDPGELAIETTYYWRVDEFTPTGTVTGPVWSFTTIGSIAITDPDLLLYYDFELGEGSTALDQSGHSNHGQFMGSPQWVDGAVSIDIATLDYIETAAPLNIVSNTVSVTGWVKHDESPAAWSGILTHRGTSPGCLGLQHNGAELRYMWGADVYWDFSSGLEMPVGEWYFAALTISPDQGKLYLNGIEQTATNVAPHEPTNFDSLIRVGRDHNDGRIMTSLIDEVRFYNRTLTDVDIQTMLMSDVTAPGDVVQGDPNEPRDGSIAGWPDGEYPWMATDDDASTKFLHFRGEVSPTGFVTEPAMGPTIVTGLTLTTANDAPERDPASFELSGSNDSIDGPYELIASGEVADFAMADAWPRFTMNATAISFENTTAYKYYQVMFPTVRDAATANSMQIAEVELLGVPSPLVGHWKLDGDALDSSGYGNDGVVMGDPQWVEGIVDGAIELDGDGDFVDCGNSPVLAITGDITVACWIKVNQFTTDWQAIVTTGDSSWRVHRSGGTNNIAFGSNGLTPSGDLTGSTDVSTGEWFHVAAVYNGAQKLLYIDGALDASADTTGNINASTYNVNIGENNQQTGRYFNGLIDDVRIYNQALSEAEISDIVSPPATGPVAHWTLDEGSGTAVADVSGNGNDGTIMDNPDLPDPTWIDGISGSALEFHGTGVAGTGGDHIDCGNDASLDITGPISIALWIRPDADDPEGKGTSGGETAPMSKATSDWSYQVRYGWGGAPTPYMSFTFNTSPRAWASVGKNLVRNEWCHIACSYDGTTLKCYLDGVETDSTPMGEIHSSADPVLIGSDGWGSDWTGAIDDVRIYDRGLSADEIVDIAAGL